MSQKSQCAQPLYTSNAVYKRCQIRNVLCIALLLVSSLTAYAQNKPNYSLLWRISGKGLTRPSYLFGTMHVKDKRAFGFSDSVMLALQKSDAFALEVHPDTLMNKMLSNITKSDSGRVEKLLTKEQYAELSKRFEEKNGYPMLKANTSTIQNLIDRDRSKPDDKQTFVDAYLFGIAKTLNKAVYGLEKAEDQIDLLDEEDDDLKERILAYLDNADTFAEEEEMEELTKLYIAGNLEDIYSYLYTSGTMDSTLTKRNHVMLNSMIKYMSTHSLFTAVGTAHLPGNDGLIALLKAQGYTVTPVNALFTGVADKFSIDASKFAWTTYRSDADGYTVDMPGEPIKQDAGQGELQLVVYPDMTNEAYYGAFAVRWPVGDKKLSPAQLLKRAVTQYKKNMEFTLNSEKSVIVNGMPAIDLVTTSNKNTMRMQFLLQNNILYCQYMGNEASKLHQPYSTRYFNSIKIFKPKEKPVAAPINYINTRGAFTVQLPAEPQVITKEIPSTTVKDREPYILNLYLSVDQKNMMNYLVRYNDLPAGLYLKDPQAAFDGIIDEVKSKATIVKQPVKIYKDGFEGRSLRLKMGNFDTDVQLFVRGNREYVILRQNLTEGTRTPVSDNFFNSFKFTPYETAPSLIHKPYDESFGVDMFVKPRLTNDSTENNSYIQHTVTAQSTNPASGALYYMEYGKISPYYRIAHVDSLYKKIINDLVPYTDTLLKVDTVLFSGMPGREFTTQNKTGLTKKRARILINNGNMVYLTGHMNSSEYFSKTSDRFFNSYVKYKDTEPFDMAALKAALIFNDLHSADTTISKQANGALDYYEFAQEELPLVYAALKQPFADDTLDRGTRYKLIEVLRKTHDAQTLKQLDTVYHHANTGDELRANILNVLPDIDKTEGYKLYMELLTNGPAIKLEENYRVFSPLNDSLAYAASNIHRILPLIDRAEYRPNIMTLMNNMLRDEEHPEYLELLKSNYKTLTKYADHDLNRYISDTTANAWNTSIYHYLQLMSKVTGQPGTDSFTLKAMGKTGDDSQLLNAATTRIANNLPIRQPIVIKLLDSLYTRFELMDAYHKMNQISKVPVKYRTPAEFGKICLYNYVGENSDDEAYPEKIILLGKVPYKGLTYYAYKYTLPNDESKKEYIGVYGPNNGATAKLDFKDYHAYALWQSKKVNWQQQAVKMITEWKSQSK
jgi:uncharacterized protein YbaP (TraB family)